MICELSNKMTRYICWFMSYGDKDPKKPRPDTEVSIMEFIAGILLTVIITVILLWWWVPGVWLYHIIRWGSINDVLYKKRFKCKTKDSKL